MWVRQYPVTDVAEEAEVELHTAIDMFQWLREVCSTHLLQTPIVLGGKVLLFKLMNLFSDTSQRLIA